LSTATGSSGHSLSAGGPILHPTLDCAILNMLAPRTLSFRPLILPITESNPIKLGMCLDSRAQECDIHLDGVSVGKLTKEGLISVTCSLIQIIFSKTLLGFQVKQSSSSFDLLRTDFRLEF